MPGERAEGMACPCPPLPGPLLCRTAGGKGAFRDPPRTDTSKSTRTNGKTPGILPLGWQAPRAPVTGAAPSCDCPWPARSHILHRSRGETPGAPPGHLLGRAVLRFSTLLPWGQLLPMCETPGRGSQQPHGTPCRPTTRLVWQGGGSSRAWRRS